VSKKDVHAIRCHYCVCLAEKINKKCRYFTFLLTLNDASIVALRIVAMLKDTKGHFPLYFRVAAAGNSDLCCRLEMLLKGLARPLPPFAK
jgi:hypothetical protein